MRAIIPVAGIGTRLRPHTFTLPKVLLNVAGKPILGHIIDQLIESGINDIVVVVGYKGELVRQYLNSVYTVDFHFVEQVDPKGLGHAIWCARDFIIDTEPTLIVLGDTIFDFDLGKVLNSKTSSLGVKQVPDPRRFGVVEMSGEVITRLVEKPEVPPTNLAIVGIYYIKDSGLLKNSLSRLLDEHITTVNEYQLTDALQLMIEAGEVFSTFRVDGWFDCGKVETLLQTNQHLLMKQNITPKSIPADVVVIPPVFIADDAILERSVIGPFATISSGVRVSDSIVRNSIVSDGSIISQVLLDFSVIGNNAVVGSKFTSVNAGDSSEIISR